MSVKPYESWYVPAGHGVPVGDVEPGEHTVPGMAEHVSGQPLVTFAMPVLLPAVPAAFCMQTCTHHPLIHSPIRSTVVTHKAKRDVPGQLMQEELPPGPYRPAGQRCPVLFREPTPHA